MVSTRLKFLGAMYERLETSLFNVRLFCSMAWLKWEWMDCVSFHIAVNKASFLHFVAYETYPGKIRIFVVILRHLMIMDSTVKVTYSNSLNQRTVADQMTWSTSHAPWDGIHQSGSGCLKRTLAHDPNSSVEGCSLRCNIFLWDRYLWSKELW